MVQPPTASSARPDPGRDVRRLLVEQRPPGVQRGEPVEQRAAGGGQIGPGEVLVDVVVRVDQARRDQAAVGPQRPRRRPAASSAGPPTAVTNPPRAGHPAAGDLAPVVVHRDDQVGAGDQQVDTGGRYGRVGRAERRRWRPWRRTLSGCRPAVAGARDVTTATRRRRRPGRPVVAGEADSAPALEQRCSGAREAAHPEPPGGGVTPGLLGGERSRRVGRDDLERRHGSAPARACAARSRRSTAAEDRVVAAGHRRAERAEVDGHARPPRRPRPRPARAGPARPRRTARW